MKLRYSGDQVVTIRGVDFPPGKVVEIEDESLIEKMLAWPNVSEVKSRGRKKNVKIEG